MVRFYEISDLEIQEDLEAALDRKAEQLGNQAKAIANRKKQLANRKAQADNHDTIRTLAQKQTENG